MLFRMTGELIRYIDIYAPAYIIIKCLNRFKIMLHFFCVFKKKYRIALQEL